MILKTKILPKNKLKIEDPPIRNYEVGSNPNSYTIIYNLQGFFFFFFSCGAILQVTEIWVTRMALVVSEGMVAGCNFAVYYSWGAYFMKTWNSNDICFGWKVWCICVTRLVEHTIHGFSVLFGWLMVMRLLRCWNKFEDVVTSEQCVVAAVECEGRRFNGFQYHSFQCHS